RESVSEAVATVMAMIQFARSSPDTRETLKRASISLRRGTAVAYKVDSRVLTRSFRAPSPTIHKAGTVIAIQAIARWFIQIRPDFSGEEARRQGNTNGSRAA